MPLNILRLNHAPSSHPNNLISFIKPLPRESRHQPDYDRASTYLYAIAAQCLPVMQTHHLSVTTLEEHEPNREFIGRNFNNGEIIQLVLRRRDGSWLGLNQVQMVMMHELAHNVHMNHGKGFWVERNKFAEQMKGLWGRGYTGEGFWGQGRDLSSLRTFDGNSVEIGTGKEVEQLCGGTYRSRRVKKRKRGGQGGSANDLTWKEKRDKRIEKKFGKNGVSLGEDEGARMGLEAGRKGPVGGNPRVAGSKRGRELRAAAALARFNQKEETAVKLESEISGTESDYDEVEDTRDGNTKPAVDADGNQILDSMGFGMAKICADQDISQSDIKQELEDFGSLNCIPSVTERSDTSQTEGTSDTSKKVKIEPVDPGGEATKITLNRKQTPKSRIRTADSAESTAPRRRGMKLESISPLAGPLDSPQLNHGPAAHSLPADTFGPSPGSDSSTLCPICSTANTSSSIITCITCGHVLDRRKDPRSWQCRHKECLGSLYVNSGDYTRCGACGSPREA